MIYTHAMARGNQQSKRQRATKNGTHRDTKPISAGSRNDEVPLPTLQLNIVRFEDLMLEEALPDSPSS